MERNPRAFTSMRNYRNLPWQIQHPLERNPNLNRSMRDYRDQWMSTPVYSVPSTYAPPAPPQYTSTPQPPQPPQLISPIEQAILDLTKLVGNFVEAQRTINAQLSQKIDTMENNVNKRIDGLQREMEHKSDILHESISKLTNQLVHQEEENPEEVCLSDTMVEEQCLQQLQEGLVEHFESSEIGAAVCLWEKKEAIPLLLTEEPVEEHKEKNLPLPPTDSVYILPSPAPQSQPKTPEAPSTKATPSLPILQNFRKLVATVQNFPLHQRHEQLPTLHGTAVGSGASSDLVHPNLGIFKLRLFQ